MFASGGGWIQYEGEVSYGGSSDPPLANNGDICHTSNIDTLVLRPIYHLISTDISNFCPKLIGSMSAFSLADGDSYFTIFISLPFYMFLYAYQSKSSLILQIGCKPHNASILCNLFHKCHISITGITYSNKFCWTTIPHTIHLSLQFYNLYLQVQYWSFVDENKSDIFGHKIQN